MPETLVQADFDELQTRINAGDYLGYYDYLISKGYVTYPTLAKQVVSNSTLQAKLANNYAELAGDFYGVDLSYGSALHTDMMKEIAIADLTFRQLNPSSEVDGDADHTIHKDALDSIGLAHDVWALHIHLEYAADKNAAFQDFLDQDGLFTDSVIEPTGVFFGNTLRYDFSRSISPLISCSTARF